MLLGVADYATFVVSVIVLLMLPGPGNLALITATGHGGIRSGLAATFGIMLGDQILLWAAVAGVSALLKATPVVFLAVQYLGSAYLIWLGWQLLRSKDDALPAIKLRPGSYCRQALLITLLNPKAIMFYMAFFPLFINPQFHQGVVTFAFMGLTIAVLMFFYGLSVSLLTKYLANSLNKNPRARQWLERIAGILLVGFGVQLLFSRI